MIAKKRLRGDRLHRRRRLGVDGVVRMLRRLRGRRDWRGVLRQRFGGRILGCRVSCRFSGVGSNLQVLRGPWRSRGVCRVTP